MHLRRSKFLRWGQAPLVLIAATAATEPPSLKQALGNAAVYVTNFHRQLATIVAEETYVQEIKYQEEHESGGQVVLRRRLRSDLLLVRPAGVDRYVEYRDVFEVDGDPVRDRAERVTRLLRDPAGGAKLGAIIRESARYNIGRVTRTINTPLLPLMFFDAATQRRFTFTRQTKSAPVLRDSAAKEITNAPVFRVSTEVWAIAYRERGRNTIVRTPQGEDLPVHGRFWINPETGAVLISEIVAQVRDLTATITVSYQSEPLMGFLVPVEMRESYVSSRERVEGVATYGKFRQVK
jgi:hypothetical protein